MSQPPHPLPSPPDPPEGDDHAASAHLSLMPVLVPAAVCFVALGVAAAAAWKIRQIKASRASAMAPAGGAAPAVAVDPDSPFQATVENRGAAPGPAPEGMVWIPGGEFSMGCDDPRAGVCGGPDAMPDARPIHRVQVDGFWMDRTEVTNAQFARFVAATGYVTMAERTPRQEDFPTAPPENLVAGSTVFTPTAEEVPLTSHFLWWRYEAGANWRHPEGAGTSIDGRDDYPVVQVAYEDAAAYARWAGKRLPTEAEFEFAERGGQAGQRYAWGAELQPGGRWMANVYQGTFPVQDTGRDGFAGLAPVAQFPPNPYGLHDTAGNVWEWVSDWYRPDTYVLHAKLGVVRNPTGPETPFDPAEPDQPKRVHRGGSFLCTDQYCTRYMNGTRGKGEITTASNHLGFRCVQ